MVDSLIYPLCPKGCNLFLSWEFELFSDVSCGIFLGGDGWEGSCYFFSDLNFFQTGVKDNLLSVF